MRTILKVPGLVFALKRVWGVHYSNEAGMIALQLGPVIFEVDA